MKHHSPRGFTGSSSISDQERANLLLQWAQMESSGIDTFRSMEILRDGAQGSAPAIIGQALAKMKTGVSPATAWSGVGLLHNWHSELLLAGFAAGRAEAALRTIAENLTARVARWNRFKSKMVFPFAIMTLAGFISALPALVTNQIGFIGFVFQIAAAPAATGALILISIRLLQSAEDSSASNLLVTLPAVGRWLELRTRADFLTISAQALRAGIPALQALPLASDAIRPPLMGRRYAHATELVAGGMSVAEALKQIGALDAAGFALVNAGEHSGALDDTLERSADLIDQAAQDYADQVTAWVPRLIYAVVAGLMVIKIFGFWSSFTILD